MKQWLSPEQSVKEKLAFSGWKYRHYFSLIDVKGKDLNVTCTLCSRGMCWSNSHLMKHLSKAHATTKLVARITVNTVDETSAAASSRPANKEGHGDGATTSKQQKLDFSAQSKRLTQTELNALIGRYVVENMLPLSTVDSDSFRALIAKIPSRGGAIPPCRKTFMKYNKYVKINAELKKCFEEKEYVSPTADIWT